MEVFIWILVWLMLILVVYMLVVLSHRQDLQDKKINGLKRIMISKLIKLELENKVIDYVTVSELSDYLGDLSELKSKLAELRKRST